MPCVGAALAAIDMGVALPGESRMNPLLQRWWGNAGCRGVPCARPFLVCHVMIAPEGAPTAAEEKAGCRGGPCARHFLIVTL